MLLIVVMTGLEPVLGMLRLAVHTKVGFTVSKEVVIRYSQPHSYRLVHTSVYQFRHITIKNGVRLSAFVLTFVPIVMFGLLIPIYVG